MQNYVEVIRISIVIFPFIALLISLPFILIQYHKYGSISFYKAILIYSFALYILCAYFLVILPLPKIEEVALLTSPRVQLIPFSFITDFIRETSLNIANTSTYIKALKESCFYVPLYNIFLTLPFGIYLKYCFKCNLKKTVLLTFILSLFFELTQLTGLYFIYPRGYRLFDVDDLMLNTFGGILGYLIAKPLIKILPKMDKVELKSKIKGQNISGFRRTTTFFFDLFLISIIISLSYFINFKYTSYIITFIYYFIIPIFLNGSTLGEKFLNVRVVGDDNNINMIRLLYRRFIFTIIYIGLPMLFSLGFIKDIYRMIFMGLIFLIYVITFFKYLFTNKLMLYEKISKTKLVSTIKIEEKNS